MLVRGQAVWQEATTSPSLEEVRGVAGGVVMGVAIGFKETG